MLPIDSYNPSSFLTNSGNIPFSHDSYDSHDVSMTDVSESAFENSLNKTSEFTHITNELPVPPVMSLDSMVLQQSPSSKNSKPTLQSMPFEILYQILQNVILDECDGNPANYYSTVSRFSDLVASNLSFYNVGTPILYRHVAFAHPHAFDRFLKSIEKTRFGTYTRTIDFSGFTSVGLGRSNRMNQEIQMLTSSTILRCLELCPNLNEFLASENIEQDIDINVLEKLYSLPYLQALDFCGATHSSFVDAIAQSCGFFKNENGEYIRTQDPQALEYYSRPILNITRLSLHGCSTLPANVIAALIQRLPNLSRLDLTHTQITSSCLHSISSSASLSHLSISKCALLSSNETAQFFLFHPAVRHLKWLNMMYEGTRPSPLSRESVALIVNSLPPLEYLNLHGLPVENLQPLINMNLISLSLGYANIPLDIIKRLLAHLPNLEYLDLTGNPNINIWTVQDTTLLNSNTNIRMFEFNRDLLAKLDGIVIPGFKVALGQGRRGWIFRGDRVPTNKSLNSNTYNGPSVLSGKIHELTVTSPQLLPTNGFTFSAYAKNRISEQEAQKEAARAISGVVASPQPSPETRPVTVLGMDMGSPAWRNASRKMNTCFIGIGGNMTDDAVKERGIYLYYGYRK